QQEQRKVLQQAQERQRLIELQPGREKSGPGFNEQSGKLKPRLPPKREPAKTGAKSEAKPAPGNDIEIGKAKPNAPGGEKVVVAEDKPSEVNKQVEAALAGQPGAPAAQAPPPDPPAEATYTVTIIALVLVLGYAGFCATCFQLGRRAI